jgi:hypothetical protein
MKPSSVALHGTIAGTQVRCLRLTGPMFTGLNNNDDSASSRVGHGPGRGLYLILSLGRHILFQ